MLGDFNGVNFTYAGVTSTFFRRDGKFMVRTDGPEGVLDRSGGSSNKLNVWDGIVGVRGAVSLGDSGDWFLPYYLDIGVGNYSNWIWQGWTGGRLSFRLGRCRARIPQPLLLHDRR